MTDLESMVLRAQAGDLAAFTTLVHLFQDMAVGYGYSLLRDFHRAEDAAQEAFVEAYSNLSKLREPAAFPSWFRKIVFKHCDRLTRRKAASIARLESGPVILCSNAVPLDGLERQEVHQALLAAIRKAVDHIGLPKVGTLNNPEPPTRARQRPSKTPTPKAAFAPSVVLGRVARKRHRTETTPRPGATERAFELRLWLEHSNLRAGLAFLTGNSQVDPPRFLIEITRSGIFRGGDLFG